MTIAPLTPEQQRQLAARMAGMNFPGVRQAWMDDPRTRLGQTALEAGTSSEGVADGGWGILEGLSRMGQGYLGGKVSREQFKDYSAESDRAARAFYEGYGGGGQPPAMDIAQGAPDQAALAQAGNQPLMGIAQNLAGTQAPPAAAPVAAGTGGAPLVNPTQPPAQMGPGVRSVLSLQPPAPSPQQASVATGGGPVGASAYLDYRSPAYDSLEAAAEKRHGLPPGILKSIRVNGERSNANQVSSSGARTVYQFIPGTRRAFKNKYGVDAWGGPRQSVEAAALHIKESLDRNGGDVVGAVKDYRGYNATHDDAYIKRVVEPLGIKYSAGGSAGSAGGGGFPGSPSLTDTSYNPVAVPDLPPEPERPVEPTIDPIRVSPRKQLAERLMAGATGPGDANRMFPLVQQYLDQGMGEEADLNKQREENIAQLRSLGYQTDMQTYGSMRGKRYDSMINARDKAIEANIEGAAGDVQHARNLELYGIKGDTARDVAETRSAPKEYDPNDPRIIKNIREISAAGTAANSTADDATQGLIISRRLNPGGWNAVKGVTAARQAYSADITALEALRKRLVMGLLNNKLGGGISNSDVSFLEASTPIGNETPRQQIQKELSRILNIANRSKQYTQGALSAFRDGTYPQFAANWSTYESEAPLTNQWGPIPFDQLPSYDQWLAAQGQR